MLSEINDFLLSFIFEMAEESLILIPFYYILFSTQLRPVLIVANIIK